MPACLATCSCTAKYYRRAGLGAGIFFVVYAFLGVPANLLMRKLGARTWIGTTTLLWGFLSAAMAWADTEAKFLIVRTLLGAAEAGFFPGMIYLTSQWFPQRNRASIMGLFYMGAPLALTLGSPLSGTALAAGIGFINLFGAVGGFIAPILRVKAETLFSSDAAGLLTLAAVAVIGSLIIFTLRVNRTVAQIDVAHH
ncbi:MFS transporter [Escherichia coli]|nr:MFS transporter [Escherichia coli]